MDGNYAIVGWLWGGAFSSTACQSFGQLVGKNVQIVRFRFLADLTASLMSDGGDGNVVSSFKGQVHCLQTALAVLYNVEFDSGVGQNAVSAAPNARFVNKQLLAFVQLHKPESSFGIPSNYGPTLHVQVFVVDFETVGENWDTSVAIGIRGSRDQRSRVRGHG